jgi:hypothetical protein
VLGDRLNELISEAGENRLTPVSQCRARADCATQAQAASAA